MEFINEVYFGRSAIAPLQKQLSKIREKFKYKKVSNTTNMDSDIVKFNRMAESFFGFHNFSLYLLSDYSINACAIPVDTFFTEEEARSIRNSITANPTGFKFTNEFQKVSLVIAINMGTIEADWISDQELMAMVLHEIGHGFFEAVTDPECIYSNAARKMVSTLGYVNDLALDKVKNNGKYVSEKIIDVELSKISGTLHDLREKLGKLKARIFKESMTDNMVKSRIEYTNEKFADTFASMYGYSEELHSVLNNLLNNLYKEYRGVKTYPRIVEIIKMYKMYLRDLLEYAMNIQDEHPEGLARVKTTVDYLKKELSKEGLDPKLKTQLISDLNRCNKLIEDYINFPKDEDAMRIQRLYAIKLYEKFGGDRREQDTDNDALFDAIDKRYNELRKKKKS